MLEKQEERDKAAAYALLRVFLGVNIGLHGLSRLVDPAKFQAGIEKQFAQSPLPHGAVALFATALPWVEALIGLLLVVGWQTRRTLMAGAAVMIVLTFGTCLIQDWQIAGIQLIYAMAYFLLLFLHGYNGWSMDGWTKRRNRVRLDG